MKLRDAIAEIAKAETFTPGFRVSFERRERGMLSSDHFPERHEDGIPTESEAWELADRFARTDALGLKFVNIYVIRAHDFTPVAGYRARMRNAHPPRDVASSSETTTA